MAKSTHDIAVEEVAAVWQGEGWYELIWSGYGQQQGEPWWVEWDDELIGVLENAYGWKDCNEFNLPAIEYKGDNEEPWE